MTVPFSIKFAICTLILIISTNAKLVVKSPTALKDSFDYGNTTNLSYSNTIVNGIHYMVLTPQNSIIFKRAFIGTLKLADPLDACESLEPISFDYNPILLATWGDCNYAQKVKNAEMAGYKMILIVLRNEIPMGDPGMRQFRIIRLCLKIFNMIIAIDSDLAVLALSKSDGDKLINYITQAKQANTDTTVELTYSYDVEKQSYSEQGLTVTVDFWFASGDAKDSYNILETIRSVLGEFGSEVIFNPHYVLWECTGERCAENKNCISEGRYCDPLDLTPNKLRGSEAIMEDLRQICLREVNNGTAIDGPWWKYVSNFGRQCADKNLDELNTCRDAILNDLGDQIKTSIQTCIDQSTVQGENTLLKKELSLRHDMSVDHYPNLCANKECRASLGNENDIKDFICAHFLQDNLPAACVVNPIPEQPGQPAFISHNYTLPKQSSNVFNEASINILDDTAFDVRYQTNCSECKCFVDSPILTYQLQTESSFSTEIIQSFVEGETLYLLHRSDDLTTKCSIFEVSSPATLTKIAQEVGIPSYEGFRNIIFNPSDRAFVGYLSGTLIIIRKNDAGSLDKNSYFLNSNQTTISDEVYDMVYSENLVFLARGERGLEILMIKDESTSDLDNILLSLEDLEAKQGFRVTKLEADYKNKVLYIYDPNSEQESVLVLDYSNSDEISLIDSYELGIGEIKQVVISNNKLLIASEEDGKSQYIEFLLPSAKGEKPEMIKLWQFSQKINSIQCNDDQILINAGDYLYAFRKNLPYETESSQLLFDIVRKEGSGSFFLVAKENNRVLLQISPLKLNLLSIQQSPTHSFKCGLYGSNNNSNEIPFAVDVYRDSCAEAPAQSLGNVCWDHYTFDIAFTGNQFSKFDSEAFAIVPRPINVSSRNETLVKSNTTKTSQSNETNHPSNNNQTTDESSKTGGDGGVISATKKPDLIDPDAPISRFDTGNRYALVIVALLVLTCFGCVIKCLVDFVRNSKNELSDQFRHRKLEEEDNESGVELEGPPTRQHNTAQERRVHPEDEELEEQY